MKDNITADATKFVELNETHFYFTYKWCNMKTVGKISIKLYNL